MRSPFPATHTFTRVTYIYKVCWIFDDKKADLIELHNLILYNFKPYYPYVVCSDGQVHRMCLLFHFIYSFTIHVKQNNFVFKAPPQLSLMEPRITASIDGLSGSDTVSE